jgi:hypothetical protein
LLERKCVNRVLTLGHRVLHLLCTCGVHLRD